MSVSVERSNKSWAYMRKVKCARHYILIPGKNPFVMVRIPALKRFREDDPDIKRLGIKLWMVKKDKNGLPIQDFRNYHQPEIPAELARETVYDPKNDICQRCRRCVNR